MRVRGIVKWFSDSRGFGFISLEEVDVDGQVIDVFVHHSNIAGEGFKTLKHGAKVSLEVREGPQGPVALDVVEQPKNPKRCRSDRKRLRVSRTPS